MSDRLEAVRAAITDLLYDDHVERLDSGAFQVWRPEGGTLLVMQTEGGDNWAVYHHSSTPEHRIPAKGIPGTLSSLPEYAIAWVLADPWILTS